MMRHLNLSSNQRYGEASHANVKSKIPSNQALCGGCPPSPFSTRDPTELAEKRRWADFSSDEESDAPVPQQGCSPIDQDGEGDCPPSPCSTAAPDEFTTKRRWADFSSDEELEVVKQEQRWSLGEDYGDDALPRSLCARVTPPHSAIPSDTNGVDGIKETMPSQAGDIATLVAPLRPTSLRPHRLNRGNPTSYDGVVLRRTRPRKQKGDVESTYSSQQLKTDSRSFSPGSSTALKASAPRATGRAPKNAFRYQDRSRDATQCQFFIGIEEDTDFSVVRKVLGSHGANVKRIAGQTGAKLRMRGCGSAFLEGPEKKESTDPLMLCVSAPDVAAYQLAKDMVTEVLEKVYEQYREHCRRRGKVPSDVRLSYHEGYRLGAR